MSDYAAKADDYRKQAEKKLKSVLGGFFGNKHEDAADLLEKAANHYKLAKMWKDCADMYEKLATCHLKLDSKHEAAGSYVEAAKAIGKTDSARSQQLLREAVKLYTEMGRLNMAARQLRDIGEQLEKSGEKEDAVKYYAEAAELFEMENSNSDATKCKLKIAEFSAELGRYSKAVELFEEAAQRAVENNLLKYSARGYLLQAGICCLCYMRPDDIAKRLDKYRSIDLQYDGSREGTLMDGLLEARRELDESKFATLLAEYDGITRLDPWKVRILREAKRIIEEKQLTEGEGGAGGRGGDEDDEEELL